MQLQMLTSQNTTEVRCRMCELVLFVVSVLQRDEDAQVVRSSDNAHACTGELCAQLVVSLRADTLLRAVDVECGNRRVVGGLFGEVRDRDGFAVAGDAVCAARRSRGRCLHGRMCVLDFPVTLPTSVCCRPAFDMVHTLKNSPSVELYGLHGLPLTYFCPKVSPDVSSCMCGAYQILGKPEAQASQQTAEVVIGVADADECVRPVQVVPVFYLRQTMPCTPLSLPSMFDVPRFGRGSRSCAGREKRTAARSETPMNLLKLESVPLHIQGPCRATYFRRIPKKVLNLELSSGGFSADAPGVEAREAAFEAGAEFVIEPGRAFSAALSAMLLGWLRALGVSLRVCDCAKCLYVKLASKNKR